MTVQTKTWIYVVLILAVIAVAVGLIVWHSGKKAPEPAPAVTYQLALPLLRIGDKGDTIKAAQALLISAGYRCGPWANDGDFGPDTDAAVRRYQARFGLAVDGEIGGETWRSLLGL